jgi:putative endonuclease
VSGTKAPDPSRQSAFKLGLSAEGRAALLLAAKGYRELARRWKSPLSEVDLVMRRGSTIVFVGDEGAHSARRRRLVGAAAPAKAHRRRGRGLACGAPRTCGI